MPDPTPPNTVIEREALTTLERNSILDLDPWVGQRSASFRFDLLDGPTNIRLGEVHPIMDQVPVLSHDVSRTIKRQLSPIMLGVSETRDIDPIRHRILPVMVLSNGEEYPLGRYMFTDYTRVRFTSGLLSTSILVDEMFIVDQKIEIGFASRRESFINSIYQVETVDSTVTRLLDPLPITFTVEPTGFFSLGAWQQGTNRGNILSSLSVDGDYLEPWFDNKGVLRFIRSFDPADRVPDFDWDNTSKVYRDSITEINDFLDAWNRLIVVSTSSSAAVDFLEPIVGTYDVPASAPHSFFNRAFRVTEVVDLPLAHASQARAVAFNLGQRRTVFERVELSTPPDPRHDSHNVIRWQGENWLELAWSMPLVEGGEMRHVLRKAYT